MSNETPDVIIEALLSSLGDDWDPLIIADATIGRLYAKGYRIVRLGSEQDTLQRRGPVQPERQAQEGLRVEPTASAPASSRAGVP